MKNLKMKKMSTRMLVGLLTVVMLCGILIPSVLALDANQTYSFKYTTSYQFGSYMEALKLNFNQNPWITTVHIDSLNAAARFYVTDDNNKAVTDTYTKEATVDTTFNMFYTCKLSSGSSDRAGIAPYRRFWVKNGRTWYHIPSNGVGGWWRP